MENEEIKQKLADIQKLVVGLEEPLKSKAIDKLLDELSFNGNKGDKSTKRDKKEYTQAVKKVQAGRSEAIKEDEENDKKMFKTINRTEYPEIHKLNSNLQRALYILKILKDKGYDGLNPSQIVSILIDIFGIKSNLPAISMSLINDKYYTIKEKVAYRGAGANKYRIMKAGEEYIEKIVSNIHNNSGLKAETSDTNLSSEDV